MSGLFDILGDFDKAFEQTTGRFNVVDASVKPTRKASSENNPRWRAILQSVRAKLFGIQRFFR